MSNTKLELQLNDERRDLTVPQMLQTVIQGGVTAENAAASHQISTSRVARHLQAARRTTASRCSQN